MNRAHQRTSRGSETRELIMTVAERLYAEHGLSSVSNRQISEAAGQGNNTAVSYHFGSRTALVRAIVAKHGARVEAIRQQYVEAAGESTDVRDWVRCLVRPVPEYLSTLGSPSWHARFVAQVMTDPLLRALVTDRALNRESLRHTLHRLGRCLESDVPTEVRRERAAMTRHLIIHSCAERERALADGSAEPWATWEDTADALEDALAGLIMAPSFRRRTTTENPVELMMEAP